MAERGASEHCAAGPGSRGAHDEGAILLVGLLFAVAVLGLIWVLMGLGDTLVRQEHASGAADAVALSVAIQHARLMNLVVLFNLLMAAILTVRVVLRVIEVAAVIAAIPTFGASLAALVPLEAAYRATTPGVVAALQSLGMAAGMMIMSVPGVAQGTATYIAKSYAPTVSQAIVTSAGQSPYGSVYGLPLEQDLLGDTQCKKTATFATDLLQLPLDKLGMGFIAKFAGRPIRKILGTGSPFFCGLGINVEPELPGSEELLQAAEKDCTKQLSSDGVDPASPLGQQKMKLCMVKVEGPINAASDALADIGSDAIESAVGLTPPTTFKTASAFENGEVGWGLLAVVTTASETLADSGLVDTTGFGRRVVGAPPKGSDKAFAQAEFYYDCRSRWEEEDCGGPTEPMWNFRWRARLVPVLASSPTVTLLEEQLEPSFYREVDAAGFSDMADALKGMRRHVIH